MKFMLSALCLVVVLGQGVIVTRGAPVGDLDKQLKVVFVQGFGAESAFVHTGSTFESQMHAAFRGKGVSFDRSNPNREQLISKMQSADIFYLSAHSGPTTFSIGSTKVDGMQTMAVKPSDQNKNISPEGNSLIAAQDIKEALKDRPGPKLIIVNGCGLTNLDDKVPEENRISTAFGVTNTTAGRAFIGWPFPVKGNEQDTVLANFLVAWTKRKAGQPWQYPTLQEAIDSSDWADVKRPTLIGDGKLRYLQANLLQMADPNNPGEAMAGQDQNSALRLFWEITGDTSARAFIAIPTQYQAEAKKLLGVGDAFSFAGNLDGDSYAMDLKPMLDRISKMLNEAAPQARSDDTPGFALLNLLNFGGYNPIEVEFAVPKAMARVKPSKNKLQITISLHLTSRTIVDGVKDIYNGDVNLVGIPEMVDDQ